MDEKQEVGKKEVVGSKGGVAEKERGGYKGVGWMRRRRISWGRMM